MISYPKSVLFPPNSAHVLLQSYLWRYTLCWSKVFSTEHNADQLTLLSVYRVK